MSDTSFLSPRLASVTHQDIANRTGLTDSIDSIKVDSNGNHQNFENGHKQQMANGIEQTRPPYDKEKFEARDDVLVKVNAHLEKAAKGELARPLIEVVGVTWIGKTWLLKHIEENYKRENNKHVGSRPTIAIYFDFESEKLAQREPTEAETYRWYTRFLKSFVPAIERASGDSAPKALEILSERKSDEPLPPDELQGALNALKRWFVDLRRTYFPILLLDSLEKIDSALLAWLEYDILVPFVEGNQALIVTAGRQQVKWREYEIRFYSDLIRLGALEEWGALGAKGIPKWIHERYALGHPGLAAKLYEKFQAAPDGLDGVRALDGTPDEPKIVGPILQEKINEIVLNDVPATDDPGKQMNLQAVLWTISILRIFSPEILKAMVDAFGPDEYRGKSYMFFRQAAFNLIGAQIAAWRAGLNDYRVEPLVRRIMANAVRIVDGREEYLERHKTAEEWYRVALWGARSAASNKLPELLYHYCVRAKAENPNVLEEQAITEIRALADALGLHESRGEVDTLIQRLTNKDDEDLQELHRDMLEVVGAETYQEVLNVLQETLSNDERVPTM